MLTSRETIGEKQEENPVQHNVVGQCWFKLLESDPKQFIVSIFKHSTIWNNVSLCNSIPCAQGGKITLKLKVKVTSSMKMGSKIGYMYYLKDLMKDLVWSWLYRQHRSHLMAGQWWRMP